MRCLVRITFLLALCALISASQRPPEAPAPAGTPPADVQMRNWTKLTWVVHAYPNFSPDDRRIVFQSNAAGNWDLYMTDADGSHLHTLVAHPAADITPVHSPDGTRIVFVSERDGDREVYTVNADGGDLKRLTNNPAHDLHPVWNADGSRIMFSSNRGNANADDYDIYAMDADGSSLQRITSGPDIDTYASWSPDGTRIVTRRVIDDGRNNEIFVMNADGSQARNLTNNPARYDGWPTWSPDGRWIAFASGVSGQGNHCIWTMRPDGSDLRQITGPHPGMPDFNYNTQPTFSHDGRRIAYTMYRPGPRESAEICIVDVPEN